MSRFLPVHGSWSLWGKWSTCSASCGQGLTHRRRTCTNPRPSYNGNYCFDDPLEYAQCLVKQCPGKIFCYILFDCSNSCAIICNHGNTTGTVTVNVYDPNNYVSIKMANVQSKLRSLCTLMVHICSGHPGCWRDGRWIVEQLTRNAPVPNLVRFMALGMFLDHSLSLATALQFKCYDDKTKYIFLKTKYILILFFYLGTFRILRLWKIIHDNVSPPFQQLAMDVVYAHM